MDFCCPRGVPCDQPMASPARERDLPVDRLPPGVGDPLYFSWAFKRHYGEAPVAYRARIRGAAEGMGAVT